MSGSLRPTVLLSSSSHWNKHLIPHTYDTWGVTFNQRVCAGDGTKDATDHEKEGDYFQDVDFSDSRREKNPKVNRAPFLGAPTPPNLHKKFRKWGVSVLFRKQWKGLHLLTRKTTRE